MKKDNIFYDFGLFCLFWPSTAFSGLFGLFWPLMSFLSQRISYWVKIKCKWTISTNQMLKTVFEVCGSKRFTEFIHKNVIEIFVRCTVYELWFNLVCPFCMDATLCNVVWASNQKLNEQSVCSRFAWRYSFSQLSIRTLEYLAHTI